ncbi:transcription factor IIB [Rhizoctonia solani]|uniref:Transcription factor IIB n=1 Tax=Rhizoctonia solani TaxID=456999 RepID=A0A8H8NUV2_9AGAM|nr:transcription factor IIB [Rhizoctonia solani]QRW18743.1 transcription factor IIB [Rhizoctonia solani]
MCLGGIRRGVQQPKQRLVGVQPPVVSLFSSIGTHPLQLFSVSVDPTLPADSVIHFLNDHTSLPPPDASVQLIQIPEQTEQESSCDQSSPHDLTCVVLHVQSPTIQTTFIRCPPYNDGSKATLGLTHQWLHMQLRDLGREFSFEIGLVDTAGRAGVLRCSTFQEEPRIEALDPPLLHVPLDISPPGCTNPWRTIAINLATAITHFATAPYAIDEPHTALIPSGNYASTSYLKVHANCRLRRIWLSRSADGSANQAWEFGLYTG